MSRKRIGQKGRDAPLCPVRRRRKVLLARLLLPRYTEDRRTKERKRF